MKAILVSLLILLVFASCVMGQGQPTTKIYFYCLPANSFTILQAPDTPIRIGKCTLLETNVDSIGVELSKQKRVNIHFDAGRTYYFQRIITNSNYLGVTAALSPSTEQAFWLNAYFSGMGVYRHYFLDSKSGLQLVEEKR